MKINVCIQVITKLKNQYTKFTLLVILPYSAANVHFIQTRLSVCELSTGAFAIGLCHVVHWHKNKISVVKFRYVETFLLLNDFCCV